MDALHTIEVDWIEPVGGRALIRPDPRKTKTQGGVHLPDGSTHGNVRLGTMIWQGPPRWDNGSLAPYPVPGFDNIQKAHQAVSETAAAPEELTNLAQLWPVRVMYFEARMTPVRLWTGEWEDVPDPKWRAPEAPMVPDAGWAQPERPLVPDPKWKKPKNVKAGGPTPVAPLIPEPDWTPPERPLVRDPDWAPKARLVRRKVYEELQIIPHPAILGPVGLEEVPEDLPDEDKVPAQSVKDTSGPLAVPSPALSRAISERALPKQQLSRK